MGEVNVDSMIERLLQMAGDGSNMARSIQEIEVC